MSYVSWDRLGQDLIHNANRLKASIGAQIQGACNALFSTITGSSPPGTQGVFFIPHDHGPNGGVPIPRGSHWCLDTGADLEAHQIAILSAGTWWWADKNASDGVGQVGSQKLISDNAPANFLVDVPFGMDFSEVNLLDSPVVLEGRAKVHLLSGTSNTQIDVALFNRTMQLFSDIKSITTFGSIVDVSFDAIPIKKDRRNDFVFVARSDVEPLDVSLSALNICSTRDRSQRKSAALNTIDSHPLP